MYGIKAILLIRGTDSLTSEIETNNVSKDFYVNKDMFDFSEYSIIQRFTM